MLTGKFWKKQVQEVKHLGSSKKHGGAASRKRMRIGNPKYKEIEQQLVVCYDTRADDNLPISRKLLRKQSKRIANS